VKPRGLEGAIRFYEGPHYYLSNFSAFAIEVDGVRWMTVEHAYQAAKFLPEYDAIRKAIHDAPSAHEAKKIARANQAFVRPDWSSAKLRVMETLLSLKARQHPYVHRKLLETGDARLIEDSPKDSFWGRGPDWQGENHLGKLWEKLRTELQRRELACTK
jgi:ribA/ribD-fused uncharacterized protein